MQMLEDGGVVDMKDAEIAQGAVGGGRFVPPRRWDSQPRICSGGVAHSIAPKLFTEGVDSATACKTSRLVHLRRRRTFHDGVLLRCSSYLKNTYVRTCDWTINLGI